MLDGRVSAEASPEIRIGVVQPNIDPFEKWSGHEAAQMEGLLRLTESVADSGLDLVLWPETATPFYLLHPANSAWLEEIRSLVDRRNINLLTGIPDIVYYPSDAAAPAGSKVSENGRRYDSYNSSILLEPHQTGPFQKYAKIVLVPFAEHVPYSEYLNVLHAAQWNFGLGGWSIGRDTTVFSFHTRGGSARCANFICYESVFPGFVAGFVRKGAEFLTVVTNDSWWGNTSGAYQHERAAVMRAVENRRWVVQCANGGISCAVDPEGRVERSMGMYAAGALVAVVHPSDERTFYTEHGDWFAELSLAAAGCLLGFASLRPLIFRRRIHA
jgi:apolipoprotein N-acyltransferase